MSGNESDAEDIVQDAFLQVCRKLPAFRGDSEFSTWLYRVTVNAALMNRRTHASRHVKSLEQFLPQFDQAGNHARLDLDYGRVAQADELVERAQLTRMIGVAISRLPDIYRTAFVLCDLEELSAREAAEILGVKAAAVRQRVHRARLMMRGFRGAISLRRPRESTRSSGRTLSGGTPSI